MISILTSVGHNVVKKTCLICHVHYSVMFNDPFSTIN